MNTTESNSVRLNRALHSACMGNMVMAADWLKVAEAAVQSGRDKDHFVSHSHPSNRAKARAAYALADSAIHNCL